MKIDSHQHFWKYNTNSHSWITDEMAVIRQDFLPENLEKIFKEQGIDGCVAVQADQTLEENEFLLQLAEKHPIIKGVVGWVDLRNKEVEQDLIRLKEHSKLKGFRHIVQGEQDPNFLLRPNFLNGISLLEKQNYTYDILVLPHQLGAVLEFVKKFPKQKFILDHIAKPYIKDGFYDGWALLMKAIGKHENVYCKLSGMVTEADFKTWKPTEIEPYMSLVLDAFGVNRILFGSDWPVCLVAGNYKTVAELTTNFITSLSATEQQAIMGVNAVDFYNL